MNLWLRLICLLIAAPFRPRFKTSDEASSLLFRVLPLDLDFSAHMTNSRYLAIMDLGRIDLMIRSGLWRQVLRHRWTPVANAAAVRYRRELRLFERYQLVTRIVCWSGHHAFIEQVFEFASGDRKGQIAARALFKGAFYDRRERQYVSVSRIMGEIGVAADSPPVPPEIEAFIATDTALRQAASSPKAAKIE